MIMYSSWLALPLPTRNKIAHEFGIAKTSSTHVSGNEIVSDGYKVQDVENALSIEAMQKFTDADTKDEAELFSLVIDRVTGTPKMVVESFTSNGETISVPKPELKKTIKKTLKKK